MAPKTKTTQPPRQLPSALQAIRLHDRPKKVVSTSAIFAQVPKLKAAAATSNPQLSTTKSRAQNESSGLKKRIKYDRIAPEHPLAAEFNQSTIEYSSYLLSVAESFLCESRDALLARVNDRSLESFLTANERRLAYQLALPLEKEVVGANQEWEKAGVNVQKYGVLGERMAKFKNYVDQEERVLGELKDEYTAAMKEIQELMRQILGAGDENEDKRSQDTGLLEKLKQDQGHGLNTKTQLDQLFSAGVEELETEIDVLGYDAIKELKKEKKLEGAKRKKIIDVLMEDFESEE